MLSLTCFACDLIVILNFAGFEINYYYYYYYCGYGHKKIRTKKNIPFHGEEKTYKNGQKQTKNGYCVNPALKAVYHPANSGGLQ